MSDRSDATSVDQPPLAPLLTLRLIDERTQWDFSRRADPTPHGFAVRCLPGRGYGVVATRKFARGERVVAEAPLIACCGERGTHLYHLDALVGELDDDARREYYGLADKEAEGGSSSNGGRRGKTAAGIWNTNTFVTEDILGDGLAESKDGVRRLAIFRLISRFNHACRPNTFVAWSATIGGRQVQQPLIARGNAHHVTPAR